MRLKVCVTALGSGGVVDDAIELYCGTGEQILQWIGYAVCARLAYKRGEVYGSYVPQAVLTKDGQPLDIDLVLNEILSDGDEVYVEYSNGPQAYRVRWPGRPKTPPFQWGDGAEILPSHDAWLVNLDLWGEGIGPLLKNEVQPHERKEMSRDLVKVKSILVKYAGALQAVFLLYECEGGKAVDQLGNMTLPQFRTAMAAAHAVSPRFTSDKVDEVFTAVATSEPALARHKDSDNGVHSFSIVDFFVAVLYLAHQRAALDNQDGPAIPLSNKLTHLMTDCFELFLFPEIQRKLDRFNPATTPATLSLLKKGRRLTEQTLSTCQLKRIRSATVQVDLRFVGTHLQRWNLLGREFNIAELAYMVAFAKQHHTDPTHFTLQPVPLDLTNDQFERLLLAITHHMYFMKKKHDPFEEFLGETLDYVYKKAGVLVAAAKE